MDREAQTPLRMDEILSSLRSSFGKQYCLHPQAGPTCSGNIIKAHTIQRNGGLSRVASKGHVYTFDPGTAQLVKTGKLAAKLIGIGSASTFTGFCGKHDNEIFDPIEKHPFDYTLEAFFLLAYRALCRELFYKRGRLDHHKHLRDMDRGSSATQQAALQSFLVAADEGVRAGLTELEHIKTQYDDVLLNRDFSRVRHYTIELANVPDLVTSGMFQPEYDYAGQKLQDLGETKRILDYIALSVMPTDSGGAIVLSWLDELDANRQLAKSLDAIQDVAVSDAVLRLAIEHLENTFLSPIWWDQLPSDVQQKLLKRSYSGMFPMDSRGPHSLLDDGVRAAEWSVIRRSTNAF